MRPHGENRYDDPPFGGAKSMMDPVVLRVRPSNSSLSSVKASTECSGFHATLSTTPLHGPGEERRARLGTGVCVCVCVC